ncbi:MAG: hypothetical protein MJ132_00620 [Clostridia bacterium]|nr:hypothetical protein [Clostridia bacterium]
MISGNENAPARVIEEIVDNPKRLKEYKQHLCEVSKQYDVGQIVPMYENLFKELL